ncbi:hypothetical protein BGZ88_008033 [Linnemannia elongata]|nr:hypothetical protein BGZ88_008033 [Linnemannia elongata]
MIYRWFEIRTSYGEMSVPLVNPVAVKMKLQEMVESGVQPMPLIDEIGSSAKFGARVMCLANLKVRNGLVNGSMGTVVGVHAATIQIRLDAGQDHYIPNIRRSTGNGSHDRRQFPLV